MGGFRATVEQFCLIESTDAWEHREPADYVEVLTEAYGPPDEVSADEVRWVGKMPGFVEVMVKDELIPHDFPQPHKDFLYGSREIAVPPEVVEELLSISPSIVVDELKGLVTARCGALVKVAATLGFVEDVANGSIHADRETYAKRVTENDTPPWFKNELNEGWVQDKWKRIKTRVAGGFEDMVKQRMADAADVELKQDKAALGEEPEEEE